MAALLWIQERTLRAPIVLDKPLNIDFIVSVIFTNSPMELLQAMQAFARVAELGSFHAGGRRARALARDGEHPRAPARAALRREAPESHDPQGRGHASRRGLPRPLPAGIRGTGRGPGNPAPRPRAADRQPAHRRARLLRPAPPAAGAARIPRAISGHRGRTALQRAHRRPRRGARGPRRARGPVTDPNLVARPVAGSRWIFCASPAYLARSGRPQSRCRSRPASRSSDPSPPRPGSRGPGSSRTGATPPRSSGSGSRSSRDGGGHARRRRDGAGIAQTLDLMAARALMQGELQIVLPDCNPARPGAFGGPYARGAAPRPGAGIFQISCAT